jgi:hypothetical protein
MNKPLLAAMTLLALAGTAHADPYRGNAAPGAMNRGPEADPFSPRIEPVPPPELHCGVGRLSRDCWIRWQHYALEAAVADVDPAVARPLWGHKKACLMWRADLPDPLPWWARPRAMHPDDNRVLVPLYMCPRETNYPDCGFVPAAPRQGYVELSPDGCEYEFAISEVLATCRPDQMGSDAAMRRCINLRAIVIKTNPTFCQDYVGICPSIR